MAGKKPELQLYNSMTKEKEVFKPIVEGKVGMYICGVTSYDLSHIGHARAYVAFDVLYRFAAPPFSFMFACFCAEKKFVFVWNSRGGSCLFLVIVRLL